jgi:hypothetical protein
LHKGRNAADCRFDFQSPTALSARHDVEATTATHQYSQFLQSQKGQHVHQLIIMQSRNGAWTISVRGIDSSGGTGGGTQLTVGRLQQQCVSFATPAATGSSTARCCGQGIPLLRLLVAH